MRESKFIAQVMVVGENRKFPAALIVTAFRIVADYFNQKGVELRSNREIVTDRQVNALIESEIQRLNERFGHYAQIKKFVLLAEEWSLAGGELTPTLKLKRRQLVQKYTGEIESLYAGEEKPRSGGPQTPGDEQLVNATDRR
jgi:long-chain acyl-CoA synthetase